VFSEIAIGSTEPVEVHQISTSDPVLFLGMSTATIVMFGKIVTWALDTWKKVVEIKKIRAETQKSPLFSEEEVKLIFDKKIEDIIRGSIMEKVNELLPTSGGSTGRVNELRTDLTWALESVLTRVERGMTVELRFLPPPQRADAAPTPGQQSVETLQEIASKLVFPPAEVSPILPLPPPEPPTPA
jgi:hypothetical protein